MLLIAIATIVIILDQITKYIVAVNMVEGMSIPIIDEIVHLTFILNPGAAFGLLENNRWFFVATAIIVLAIIFFYRREIQAEAKLVQVGIALFAGGALGNLIDRVRMGLVIDFFDIRIWPVFNIADIAICMGVGLILWITIKTELTKTK